MSSDAFGRYVAQIWGDLREEASRGMRDDEARACAERTSDARGAQRNAACRCALGLGTLRRRCIAADRSSDPRRRRSTASSCRCPRRSRGAFERVIVEEDIPHRFLVTARESAAGRRCCSPSFGIGIGVLLYRVKLLRDATETWVAAMAVGADSC